MKYKIKLLLLSLLMSALLLPLGGATKRPTEYGERELGLISRITAQLLSKNHYRQQQLDSKLSEKLFDEYFDELDPGRLFFSEEDIARFAPDREKLCDQLVKGDSSFAFKVYDLYRTRNNEYRAYAEKRLKEPFDFKLDETFNPDRSKAMRAKDFTELEKLWYLKLKNDVLAYRLLNRVQEETKAKRVENMSEEEKKRADNASKWSSQTPEEKVLDRLRDINNDVVKRDRIDVLGTYLNSLAQVYGPHSNYYPPKQEEDFDMQMSLSLSGIGATLSSEGGYIKIVGFSPGGPAARDGRLKVEDRIIAVAQDGADPVDVIDMPLTKAVQLIRGPEKSKVTLTILPGDKGRNAVPETVTITRDKIQLVESAARGEIRTIKTADGKERKIGIINLPSFYMDFDGAMRGDANYRSCSRDVKKILEDFNEKKVDSVVMDLRRNGGGSLEEAVNLTGLFIPQGPVVQIRTGNNRVQLRTVEENKQVYKGPLVVLTSKLSASAAEIFSAAIRDSERGILVGDSRTFGKGTVLNVIPLERYMKFIGEEFPAGSTTYETAIFFRIAGGSVQQLGIESDIKLPSLTDRMEVGEMFMNNHLPWDSLKPVQSQRFISDFRNKVNKLSTASAARVEADPEYRAFRKKLELYDRFKEKKTVSLNEETRWKEYKEEQQVQEEAEKLYREQAASGNEKNNDPVLNEAVHIAADFAELS